MNILRCGCPALSGKRSNKFSFIYFSDSFYWESPEDFLTNHHQYFAFIHTTSIGDEGERNLKDAKGLYFKFRFRRKLNILNSTPQ